MNLLKVINETKSTKMQYLHGGRYDQCSGADFCYRYLGDVDASVDFFDESSINLDGLMTDERVLCSGG